MGLNRTTSLGWVVKVRWVAAAGSTVTGAVWVTGIEPFTVALTVFTSALVEAKVPAIWPFTSLVPTGCVSVLPVVGEAASVTGAPLTGFPKASSTVTVMVEAFAPLLAVIGLGEALMVDRLELGVPDRFTVWVTGPDALVA